MADLPKDRDDSVGKRFGLRQPRKSVASTKRRSLESEISKKDAQAGLPRRGPPSSSFEIPSDVR